MIYHILYMTYYILYIVVYEQPEDVFEHMEDIQRVWLRNTLSDTSRRSDGYAAHREQALDDGSTVHAGVITRVSSSTWVSSVRNLMTSPRCEKINK